MDLGNQRVLGDDGWIHDYNTGERYRATPEQMQALTNLYQSPSYISGEAERKRQAAADTDFGLFDDGREWMLPFMVAGGALAAGAGAGAGVGGATIADGAFAAGAMGGAAGPSFGGLTALEAAGGAAAGAGATGAANMAGTGDWWSQLGLTPADVGMEAMPWTTNPGMSDLTGGVLNNAGSTGGLGQILQQLQGIPGGSQIAQQLVGQLMGQGGGGAQGAGGAGSGGFNLGSLLPLLGIGSGLNTMFGGGSAPAVDPAMVNSLWQAGQNTYNMSLDPQNALRDRTQQRVVDSSRAGQSARGIAMSPYGAGLEDQAVSNFNIDWQNQALQRQMQGTQAFSGAGNTAAQAGVANNAQAFMQNQTGLNNLTTGVQGLFGGQPQGGGATTGGWPAAGGAQNPIGSWLSSLFGGGGGSQAGQGAYVQPGQAQPDFSAGYY